MNFLKIKVEVDAEQLAQRERNITNNNSRNVKGRSLKRRLVQNKETDEIEIQSDLYNIEDELRNLCEEYNNELKSSGYFEIVEAKGKKLSIYSLIKENLSINSIFNNLFLKLDLKQVNIEIDEVTFKEFEDRINFHRKSELCESFGIDDSIRCNCDNYIEKIIEYSDSINLINDENNYIGRDNLLNELKRIYASPIKNRFYGHPVHYFINTDDYEEFEESCETLIKALYQRKRITSRRYCMVRFEDEIRESMIDSLYRIGCGGVIVIDATSYNQDGDRGHFKRGDYLKLASLCKLIKRYKNQVLTIFCFSYNKQDVRKEFLNNFNKMIMVDLSENVVPYSQACEYLKFLAKKNKIRFKKSLTADLEQNTNLTPNNLKDYFSEWYEHNLRQSVFPQYKDIQTVQKSLYKDANYSALNELNDLIGLSKAKHLINRIIKYNKIQKLISE